MTEEESNSIPLFTANHQEIVALDFIKALQMSGVQKGDTLLVHSDLALFGNILLFNRKQLLEILLQVLKTCVGAQGTIIMPTFSFSFCKGELFDLDKTKSTDGVLTEYFRKQPDVQRTIQPIHSCAVWGVHQKFLLDISKDSFDEKSIFGKLLELKGKVVCLGAPFFSCTFNHHIEQMHGIPYRYMKTFKGTIVNGNQRYEDEFTFNVRYIDKKVEGDPSRFEKHLLVHHMKKLNIGHSSILTVSADDLFKEGYKKLDQDIFYFLKEKPNL